ncbi:hypothetical protein MUK42_35004 [Musa troglodytarum]|uniref:Uncharacterized protein n=1 Tax=Musa troglodytarum TaxID=320322 RepID=A0A9E7JBX1_9LILI|nr:hypothetical protein MUK42_35004 [Musa troglodytarum]
MEVLSYSAFQAPIVATRAAEERSVILEFQNEPETVSCRSKSIYATEGRTGIKQRYKDVKESWDFAQRVNIWKIVVLQLNSFDYAVLELLRI